MWPQYIINKSNRLPDTETIENRFYGLYDDILTECFPRDQFSLFPQYATPQMRPRSAESIDFMITYVVEANDSPIFFIEVKPPTHLPSASARKAAQNQVIDRFGDIGHLVKIPNLCGISAIGRNLAYYKWNKATGEVIPEIQPDSNVLFKDTAPIEFWDTNVMQQDGYEKFMAAVNEAKASAQAFGTYVR